ncbi:MAG: trypsin-like peptidase domain-containing protein [Spirochaetaceae bacterium]|nr:trypsin-like peptidase domain-containing protein [Spirochaetaceae bacterium]
MRLYSRGQLVFVGFCSALVVFLILFGLGTFSRKESETSAVSETSGVEPFVLNVSHSPLQGDLPSLSTPSQKYTAEEVENISIYDLLNEAVVNITTEVLIYNWFTEPIPREGTTGSGSIIDTRGYVLTNNHVVENAYKVYLALADGTQVEGEVIGTDYENDLSVIKFDPDGRELVTIPFGSSNNLRVGQKVLAIGNPFALDRTLTTGIVSGLGRPLKTDTGYIINNMIQTDASINPGNSGGPLINSNGEMIGINTLIYSPSGGSVGVGFAVPIDTAKRVIPDLINIGKVNRGTIDIVGIQLFPSLVRYGRLSVSQGVLISRIAPGSLADRSGLRGGDREKAVKSGSSVIYLGGDIIVGIGDSTVSSLSDYYSALEDTRPGDIVQVTVVRNNKKVVVDVELSERRHTY